VNFNVAASRGCAVIIHAAGIHPFMTSPEAENRRLRWHCRRGMKELDIVLGWYLDNCYATAPVVERTAFEELLTQEDPLIWRWLLGAAPLPEGPLGDVLRRLIDRR
jgi:antitoxin CptB